MVDSNACKLLEQMVYKENTIGGEKVRLYRYESGLIFDDHFDTLESYWDISNAAYTSIESSALKLSHDFLRDTIVLMDMPHYDCVFEAFITYTPTADGDKGGLIVYKSSNENVELLEVADDTLPPLSNVKVVKKGDEYDFYMNRNGAWEYIDSAVYSFKKIGFVLKKGNGSGYFPLLVDRFLSTRNDKLTIDNLLPGYQAVLVLSTGSFAKTVSSGSSMVEFELPHLVVEGTLQIYNELNELIVEETDTFYGGDIYHYGSYLEIRQNGFPLSDVSLNEMGRFINNELEVKLELHNPANTTATNVLLQVQQYLSEFGYQWADIAADSGDVPDVYGDQLLIPSIGPGETIPFWVKLTKDDSVRDINSVYFSIYIEHD